MKNRDELKQRLQMGKKLGISDAIRNIKKEQKYSGTQESQDTKNRREIQAFIKKKHIEGKSKEEILKRLRFVYGGSQYAQYRKYFEIWVDNIVGKSIEDEGQEK